MTSSEDEVARWRPMTLSDVPAVAALAALVHPGYPEDDAVFAERVTLAPAGCHVAESSDRLDAYVVSHPWAGANPPKLNALLGRLPTRPDCWYIHDIAVSPESRGKRLGSRIGPVLIEEARRAGIDRMELVSISGTEPFWRGQGFVRAAEQPAALASYGGGALLMVRQL